MKPNPSAFYRVSASAWRPLFSAVVFTSRLGVLAREVQSSVAVLRSVVHCAYRWTSRLSPPSSVRRHKLSDAKAKWAAIDDRPDVQCNSGVVSIHAPLRRQARAHSATCDHGVSSRCPCALNAAVGGLRLNCERRSYSRRSRASFLVCDRAEGGVGHRSAA